MPVQEIIKVSGKIKKYLLIIIVLVCAAIFYSIHELPDDKFHMYFLNVDQGDSILIKTPQNQQILIDGGPRDFVLEEIGKVMPFFDRELDLVVLTHPHADHMEGLIEVLKRFKASAVLISGVNVFDDTYEEFLKEIYENNISIYIAERKTDFVFGDVVLDVLYPFNPIDGDTYDNLNNSSIGINVIYKNKQILLLGDLEKEKEIELLKAPLPNNIDIYKASHHGSKTASSIEFLRKIAPKEVVIQVGKNNKFKHPHPETIRNFNRVNVEKIYRTDTDGMKEFIF